MAKTQISLGINNSGVDIYAMPDGMKSRIEKYSLDLNKKMSGDEYFNALSEKLAEFIGEHPLLQNASAAIILPDGSVALDTVSIPNARGIKVLDSLNTNIKTFYKNSSELKINKAVISSTKQSTLYGISMLRLVTYSSYIKACQAAKLLPDAVTFNTNAAVNGVLALNSKLRTASFLLLNIKNGRSTFAFVNKGKTVGSYSLPFGYEVLSDNKVVTDDVLIDHYTAELAVINAKEKAKAKKLTMASADDVNLDSDGETFEGSDDFEQAGAGIDYNQVDTLSRRAAKKTPKFMQRPTPEDEQGFVCENFRIFEKWALNLLRENTTIMSGAKPEAVYVNLPDEMSFVFDKVNEEAEENGVTFEKLDLHGETGIICENLDLYGGFFVSQYNKNNNF